MAHVYGHKLASNWRAHWLQFAIARLARIYPLFALTTLAMMMAFAWSRAPIDAVSFSGPALELQPLLLQHWYSGLSWNYPSWSISTEAEAYVFFVFCAGALLTGKYPRLMAACCVAILVALSIAQDGRLAFTHGFPALLRTLPEFSLGVLLYRYTAGQCDPTQMRGNSCCSTLGSRYRNSLGSPYRQRVWISHLLRRKCGRSVRQIP